MVPTKVLLSYKDWTITFMVNTDASDKKLGDVISQNNKPITLFYRIPRKPQCGYTTTEKEILAIFECLEKFREILCGYEINVFSYHKKMVHAAILR